MFISISRNNDTATLPGKFFYYYEDNNFIHDIKVQNAYTGKVQECLC